MTRKVDIKAEPLLMAWTLLFCAFIGLSFLHERSAAPTARTEHTAPAEETALVYHAGTKLGENGDILTSGGRVLGVTATADTLRAALDKAYAACGEIAFTDMHMRHDIGHRALQEG